MPRVPASTGRTVLIVPGVDGSGPEHWQSRWEAREPSFVRVQQRDWSRPVLSEWLHALRLAIDVAGPDPAIAAHSLGCLLVVRLLLEKMLPVAGLLLVAPPDPSGANFPARTTGFEVLPEGRLLCPSMVVASVDDPFAGIEFAARCARLWGSHFVNIGAAGHINAASGLGDWPRGRHLLRTLLEGS